MSLEINIRINAGNDGELTAHESSILKALAAHPSQGDKAVIPTGFSAAPQAAAEPAQEAPAEPAKKPAAKRTAKPAAAKPAPKEDVPMALDDNLAADPEQVEEKAEEAPALEGKVMPDNHHTVDEAVSVATTLVGEGKSALVKSALEAAGAKKVSALNTDEALAAFFAVIEKA